MPAAQPAKAVPTSAPTDTATIAAHLVSVGRRRAGEGGLAPACPPSAGLIPVPRGPARRGSKHPPARQLPAGASGPAPLRDLHLAEWLAGSEWHEQLSGFKCSVEDFLFRIVSLQP